MVSLVMASVLIKLVSVVWIAVALLLIMIILVQKGKGGGLGGAFGGAGGGGGLLGTKTGDFLTWVTIGLVFLFFALAIVLVKWGKPALSDDLRSTPIGTEQSAPADIEGTITDTEAATDEDASPVTEE